MSYLDIWEFQKQKVEEIARSESPELVIFCEHENVFTLGKRFQPGNILKARYPVYKIERGGDVTWHGPGQLVIYPLFRLQGSLFQKGLHEYLRFCEESLIRVFQDLGLDAGRYGPTGVWIRRKNSEIKKIASIGVAVRRWVTYHGISINVSCGQEGFSQIRPCNFESHIMTSLLEEGVDIGLQDLSDRIELQMKLLLVPDSERETLSPEILGGGTELFKSSANF